MIAYFQGRYLDKTHVAVSPDDRGFLLADGLYEVVRSYGGCFFQLTRHIERLNRCAVAMRFNIQDFGYLAEVAQELIHRNRFTDGDALVYIQVTRGVAPRTHYFPPAETPLSIYAAAKALQLDPAPQQKGIETLLVPDQRWSRCDLKTVGLLPNAMALQQAKEQGREEALLMRDGFIMEGTHSNFFAVFDGTVVTPPLTNYILGGITRQVVLELCRDLSLPVDLRPIAVTELPRAQELFITSTTADVTPVVVVEGAGVRERVPGPVTRKLQQAFRQRVAAECGKGLGKK